MHNFILFCKISWSALLSCFDSIGWATGRASGLKKTVVGCWCGCLSGARCKQQTVSCFSKIQIGFAFLVPAHSEKGLLNVCVCVCVFLDWCETTVGRLCHWSSWSWSTKNTRANVSCWQCTTCSSPTLASYVFCRHISENTSSSGNGSVTLLLLYSVWAYSSLLVALVVIAECTTPSGRVTCLFSGVSAG